MVNFTADITHAQIQKMVGPMAGLILEIGANDGSDTLQMLAHFPKARLFCFECDPRPIARWREKVRDPRATLAEVALSDSAGVKTFHQSGGKAGDSEDWDKSGSLCVPTLHKVRSPEISFSRTITVVTATLDEWLETNGVNGVIDFIWCDVQSAEKFVFAGAAKAIARTRFIKMECHRTELYAGQWSEAEAIAFFKGWTCIGRFADDLIFGNPRPKDS